MTNNFIENKSIALLKELGINKIPIPLDEIASKKGLMIQPYEFEDNISGALILDIKLGKGVIGYNPKDSKVRQRFTIAHELGHFVLHSPSNNIFFDQASNFTVQFRSNDLSANRVHENQANKFAAALLMPLHFLNEEIEKQHLDLSSDNCIKSLAKTFNVSVVAMAIRLSQLKFD